MLLMLTALDAIKRQAFDEAKGLLSKAAVDGDIDVRYSVPSPSPRRSY